MNIYEYQAKRILKKFGVKAPCGLVAYTPLEAKNNAQTLSSEGPWVVKAQILAGSRNSGKFLDRRAGLKGGIRISQSLDEVYKNASDMLGNQLITEQTKSQGRIVSRVLIEEFISVVKKFYFSLVVDRVSGSVVLLTSKVTDRNDDIVKTIIENPTSILRINLGIEKKVSALQLKKIKNFIGAHIKDESLKDFIQKMLKIFYSYDAVLLETNPIGITKEGEIFALDAKILFDNNALYRHPDILSLADETEIDERENIAAKFGFQYKELESGVGIIVNGDGFAASTINEAKRLGMNTACFLNLKGGIDREKITACIKLIITNPKVDGIFINILGGFSRCNLIADGILNIANDVGLNIPLVVRFEGTNKEEATDILEKSGLGLSIVKNTTEGLTILKKEIEEDL